MRIKSYFAPSVQSAISIARREFGDDVTLVTSHTASLESRHLGDYEVVFAVEDQPEAEAQRGTTQLIKAAAVAAEPLGSVQTVAAIATEEPEASVANTLANHAFAEVLQQAIATPLSTEENASEKLGRIETLLVELGLDGLMVRSLMAMIERVSGAVVPAVPATAQPAEEAAAEVADSQAGLPDLTPAELEFYLSVSVGA